MGTGGNGTERGRRGKLDVTEVELSSGFDFGTMHKHTLLRPLTLFTQYHTLEITLEVYQNPPHSFAQLYCAPGHRMYYIFCIPVPSL